LRKFLPLDTLYNNKKARIVLDCCKIGGVYYTVGELLLKKKPYLDFEEFFFNSFCDVTRLLASSKVSKYLELQNQKLFQQLIESKIFVKTGDEISLMNEPTLPFSLETYTFFDFELWCKSKNLNPLYKNIPDYKSELESVTSILNGMSFDFKLDFGSYTDYVLKKNLSYSKEIFFQYNQYVNDIVQKLGSGIDFKLDFGSYTDYVLKKKFEL